MNCTTMQKDDALRNIPKGGLSPFFILSVSGPKLGENFSDNIRIHIVKSS